jgi:NAD(P)H-hydrate epimerase
MEILSAEEMRTVDRRTAEEFGVTLETLMENAGAAVARFCLRYYPAVRRVVVLCGKGNNGGDGFVAARILANAGVAVEVLLLGREEEPKGEAAVALRRLRAEAAPVAVRSLVDEAGVAVARDVIDAAGLIVDAVVGTGFKPPLRGVAAELQSIVAQSKTPVVAVDLPSGWDADSTELSAEKVYRADAVVTFTAPKLAHVFGHLTSATFGPVVVGEIGSPTEAIRSKSRLGWTGAAKAIAEEPRAVDANKGRFGHALIVGGSDGTAGAPAMAAMAALRAGAGLVTAAVPQAIAGIVAGFTPELMVVPLGESVDALTKLIDAKRIGVVGIGPGLGCASATKEFVRGFVERVRLPMVVDADALNAFAGRAELFDGSGRTLVLTPHPGEMARLTGLTIAEVEADRIVLARRFATEHKLTLVLKGWRTLVAHPDGRVAVNTSGNPAMAKGGSGDILTGIIAAMLAQFPNDVARAVETAVYLHGLAADFAAHAMDEHTVLATDTLAHLSDAFRYRAKDADGSTWVCGLNNEGGVR